MSYLLCGYWGKIFIIMAIWLKQAPSPFSYRLTTDDMIALYGYSSPIHRLAYDPPPTHTEYSE